MALNPAGIVTPEAVVLDFELAGLASRAVARLLDFLIEGLLLLALAIVVGLAVPGTVGVIVIVIGLALVILGYPALCEMTLRGRSPGKIVFGLRVVTVEGAPTAPRHAFIRSTVGIVDFLIPPGGLCAVVSSLLSRRGQRLGDLVAGTMVLRERSATSAPTAVWFSPPAGLEAYAHNLDVSSVTSDQFAVIRSFLLRVHELTTEARLAMALRLANPVADAMHHRPPPGVHPEQFLVAVAAAYQRRHAPAPVVPSTPRLPAGYAPSPPGGYAAAASAGRGVPPAPSASGATTPAPTPVPGSAFGATAAPVRRASSASTSATAERATDGRAAGGAGRRPARAHAAAGGRARG